MIYQAYNQIPNQTMFDFEKLTGVTTTALSGHRFYKKGRISSASYELVEVNSNTTGYFYYLNNGSYILTYLPENYDSEKNYYTYKSDERIRYVPTLENVQDVSTYYTADYYSVPFSARSSRFYTP